MFPPKSMNIGGRKVKVKAVSKLRVDGEDCYGAYSYWDDTIRINEDTPDAYKVQTLLHEAMHAALKVTGISEFLDEKVEEAVCIAAELIAPNIVFKGGKE